MLPLYCPLCDANCQTYCTHHDRGQKRAALFEVMTAKELSSMLEEEKEKRTTLEPVSREFNHLLGKVLANGYITEKTYQRYFIPNS